MGIAFCASHLDAPHAEGEVVVRGDFCCVSGREGRPAASCVEFAFGVEEGRAANNAAVGSFLKVVVIFVLKRRFGGGILRDVPLQRGEPFYLLFEIFHLLFWLLITVPVCCQHCQQRGGCQ